MKVIDEKGKLFGRLNIIDLLVIIVVLLAIVVLGVKFLGGSDSDPAAGSKLVYTVRVTAQNSALTDQVKNYVDITTGKRDQLMSNGDMLDAYIVDYWTEPTTYSLASSGSVSVLDSEQAQAAGLTDICFVIEATVTDTATSPVGSQEVRVGKTHIVKTTHLEFATGVIESCTWTPLTEG